MSKSIDWQGDLFFKCFLNVVFGLFIVKSLQMLVMIDIAKM